MIGPGAIRAAEAAVALLQAEVNANAERFPQRQNESGGTPTGQG